MEDANGNSPGLADEVLAASHAAAGSRQQVDELPGAVCGMGYPVPNGVVHGVSAQNYGGSFGFQWKLHARTQSYDATRQRSKEDPRVVEQLMVRQQPGPLVTESASSQATMEVEQCAE
jgi:hypothetical protein